MGDVDSSGEIVTETTKETVRQDFKKYSPLVDEAKRIIKAEEAKAVVDSYMKNGEEGLKVIKAYPDIQKYVKERGLTLYETIHILSGVTDSSYGKNLGIKNEGEEYFEKEYSWVVEGVKEIIGKSEAKKVYELFEAGDVEKFFDVIEKEYPELAKYIEQKGVSLVMLSKALKKIVMG